MPAFLPRFTFIGIPTNAEMDPSMDPTNDTRYVPLDFLWYTQGSHNPADTFSLANPITFTVDSRFVERDGSFASPNYDHRGRSMMEDVFMRKDNPVPVFHVFPLAYLLQLRKGKITDEEWNGQFASYFPDVPIHSTYEPDENDIAFGKTISSYVEKRKKTIQLLEQLLRQHTMELPVAKVGGIQQFSLIWKKPVDGFEGSASLFYHIPATQQRPYMRLYPSEGSPITKIHVMGALPIPTLDDPIILSAWSKDTSITPGIDMCTIKYVHRPSIGRTQSIYGTIHVFQDGTMTLLVQPPSEMRRLDPIIDFRHFHRILETTFVDLPQSVEDSVIKEVSLKLIITIPVSSKKFTVQRIRQRLPYVSYFFKEIKKLPTDDAIMVLRYKAVSQYTSENDISAFITQLSMEYKLAGESFIPYGVARIQEEFQLSEKDAKERMAKWIQSKEKVTIQVPEEGEFTESNHPGTDIAIYSQHPLYYFQINRVTSIESYQRIYTLLSLLFLENDMYFKDNADATQLAQIEHEMQAEHKNQDPEDDLFGQIDNADVFGAESNEIEVGQSHANDLFANDLFANSNANDSPAPIAMAAVSKPPVAAAAAASIPVPSQLVHDTEQKLVNPKSWFIGKLQEIDKELFGTAAKDESGYSRQCGSVDDRQPVILTADQYHRMRQIYEGDYIFWIEYPLTANEDPDQPLGTEETFTIMRYGSSANNINYMFCPEFFCLSDELMIRKKDFEATEDREGKPKPRNTCPFCKGRLITNRKEVLKGATVIQRKPKDNGKYHKYIDFLKKRTHPKGIALPCCFIKHNTLRIGDNEFKELREALSQYPDHKQNANDHKHDEDDHGEYGDLVVPDGGTINYAIRFASMYDQYIIESNKNPSPGVFAIVPPHFDAFFVQHSSAIVGRSVQHTKLVPTAHGFIRIGTENTTYESLLGVIAPIIYKNTIQEVKQKLKDVIRPRVFMNAHFGNLVLEFYNPSESYAMPQTRQELALWAQSNVGITMRSENSYELLRIFNAYHRFMYFIDDPSQRKDLRHIQPLLAEPGLFTTNGIQLIIMDDNDGEITMKCPIFGVSKRHRVNDVAFISKSKRNIGTTAHIYNRYELYVYTSNKPARGKDIAVHDAIIRWDARSRAIWPQIVIERIDEYTTQCQSRYTSVYTPGAHSSPMVSLSTANSSDMCGIIKDAYNHIIAVVYDKRNESDESSFIALPVIDDGAISIVTAFTIKHIYLSWDEFPSAPLEEVLDYYRDVIAPRFVLYPGYRVAHLVKKIGSDDIIAIQLQNGIFVPVGPPTTKNAARTLGLPFIEIEEFQWNIDKQMDGITQSQMNWSKQIEDITTEKRCGVDEELLSHSTYSEFEELYQQFRYMVSNYIIQKAMVRTEIERIIFNADLPFFEKRKRLYIYFASTLLSWFYTDAGWESSVSFLRKDCRVIDQQRACTGTCHWNTDEKEEHGGRCLLHVPQSISLDQSADRMVTTSELFTKRVIDELVYFPARRNQLMKKGEISAVSKVIKPIHYDDQYIIPESSVSWATLLRLEWMTQESDGPKYYEEMSREGTEKIPQGIFPEVLEAIVGSDSSLRVYIPQDQDPARPFVSLQGILQVSLADLTIEEDAQRITKEQMYRYVTKTSMPIGFIEPGRPIEFVKPEKGTHSSILIFIRVDDKIGVVLEREGDMYVSLSSLPSTIPDEWYTVRIRAPIRKEPVEAKQPPLLVNAPKVPLPPVRAPITKTKRFNEPPSRAPIRAPIRAPSAMAMAAATSSAVLPTPAGIPASVTVPASKAVPASRAPISKAKP